MLGHCYINTDVLKETVLAHARHKRAHGAEFTVLECERMTVGKTTPGVENFAKGAVQGHKISPCQPWICPSCHTTKANNEILAGGLGDPTKCLNCKVVFELASEVLEKKSLFMNGSLFCVSHAEGKTTWS